MRVEVRAGEVPICKSARQLAAVIEIHLNIRDGRIGQFDTTGGWLIHPQYHVRILATRVTARGGSIDIGAERQGIVDVPFAIETVKVGIDHAMFSEIQQLRIETQL